MAQFCMPMLIVNMGGEMVYILEQRLTAQNVAGDKSKRVLQDVIRTMYNPMFISELFRAQDVYSMHSTRQIFDRLAHSSIMRLNESSMDKLFDLMTMGFKYQLMACSYPQELLLVTLNHLYQLRSKVLEAKAVVELVDDVIRLVNEKYAAMSTAEFGALKGALCRFFTDKRVKVSLFLQDAIQKSDGAFSLHYRGPLPPGVEMPGRVTYYGPTGSALGIDTFAFPASETISPHDVGPPLSGARQAACSLGLNMYSKEKPAVPPTAAAQATVAAAARAAASEGAPPPTPPARRVDSAAASHAILSAERAGHSKRDLNLLADLIGGAAAATESFKLNLFPDTSMDDGGGGGGPGGVIQSQIINIDIGDKAMQASNRNLLGIMDDMHLRDDEYGGGGATPEGDDLLSLMDQADDEY